MGGSCFICTSILCPIETPAEMQRLTVPRPLLGVDEMGNSYTGPAPAPSPGIQGSAALCSAVEEDTADQVYDLSDSDCAEIRATTDKLIQAVLQLHSQLQNRACMSGYFEDQYGFCSPDVPVVQPVPPPIVLSHTFILSTC